MSRFTSETQTTLIDVASEMADAARAAILPFFRNPDLMADNKEEDGFDPVTEADRAAEAAMRNVLERRRPQDGIFDEEMGKQEGESGLTWVLDPIDGTRGFLSGTPTWGVLIALSDENGPIMGVVDQPYIQERFFGGFNQAWCDGPHGRRSLRVRGPRPLNESILFTTFPEVGTQDERRAFHYLGDRMQLVRYGMDCYAYALLAAGQIDLVVEAGLNPYDIQGPQAVVQAAGGIVTDWHGGPAHNGGRVIAAASEAHHAEAMRLLEEGLANI